MSPALPNQKAHHVVFPELKALLGLKLLKSKLHQLPHESFGLHSSLWRALGLQSPPRVALALGLQAPPLCAPRQMHLPDCLRLPHLRWSGCLPAGVMVKHTVLNVRQDALCELSLEPVEYILL